MPKGKWSMKVDWEEFCVPCIDSPFQRKYPEIKAFPDMCGICSNTGKFITGIQKTPAGYKIEQKECYCICPNGRALKWGTEKINKCQKS
jgi:hypothetical protein